MTSVERRPAVPAPAGGNGADGAAAGPSLVGLVMQMAFMYFMYTNMSSKKKADPSKAQAGALTSVSETDAIVVATPLPTATATPATPELPSWMPAEVRDMMKVATESQSGKRNVPSALSWFEDARSSSIRDSKASKYVPAWHAGATFDLYVYLSECPQAQGAWPSEYEQQDWALPLPTEESGWYTSSLPAHGDSHVVDSSPAQWSLMGDKVKAWTTRASQRIGATNGIARARRNDTYTGLLRVDSSSCEASPSLLWKVQGLRLENVEGQDVEQQLQVALPSRVQENATAVFAHIYLVRDGGSMSSPSPPAVVHWVHPLLKLLRQKPIKQTFNLLGGDDEDGKRKPRQEARFGIGLSASEGDKGGEVEVGATPTPTPSPTPDPASLPFMPYWKPSMHIEPVMDFNTYAANGLPPNVKSHMQLDPSSFRPVSPSAPALQASYLPLLHVNDFWVLGHHLVPVNSSSSTVPLHLRVGVAPMWRWALQTQMSATWDVQASMGTTGEGDNDMIKTIIMDTNPVLLGITMLVSLLHMVFDFLAFRNDISFWRSAKSLEGLSVRTLTLNLVQQAIIAAYLFNENTSWMILTSQVIGLAIEVWKLRKAVAVSLSWHRTSLPFLPSTGQLPYPWVDFSDKEESYAASRTKEYDDIATAHLLFILYPLVVGYALFSLFYDRHRSWMSWLLGSLVGFVYTFGFAQMVPQLYINYRLKSVAHMPWRAMVYKALNTFIDDLFAFVVKMPTLHRLSVFRDDIIFFCYLYQRWVYPVDKARKNEYGASALDYEALEGRKKGEARQDIMASKLVYTPVAQIAGIVSEARACFNSGKTKAVQWRISQLQGIRRLILENEEELSTAVKRDLRRPDYESVTADLLNVLAEVNEALHNIRSWMADEVVPTPAMMAPGTSFIKREPLGVSCIISPWNFPISLCLNPAVGAIAAGNTVVIKPSEVAPACAEALGRLVPKYLDTDAIKIIQGGIDETTALLAQRFDIICYTGNAAVARVIMQAAAKHLTPVLLELGGKSPAIVDSSANLDLAAKRILNTKCMNAGQVCIAPDYVLVERSVEAKLVAKLKGAMTEFFGPDPQKSKDLGRIINERHFKRVEKLLKTAGASVEAGGQCDPSDLYIAPTLLRYKDAKEALDKPVMQEEIFGPLLPIIPVDNVQEAVSIVNKTEKPLALYMFSSSGRNKRYVLDNTSSGGVVENDAIMHNINPNFGFGGVGESGMGAYHGKTGFDAFSHKRSVFQQDTLLDVIGKLRYPPYTPSKLYLAKTLLMTASSLPGFPLSAKDVLILGLSAAVAVLAAKVAGKW